MTLKELRISKKLTQKEAAERLEVSLRSYIMYENDSSKEKTPKYRYLCRELEEINRIDEEHGILDYDTIRETVKEVLDNYDVEYCYLFGSYAKNTAHEQSDVDLLVSTHENGLAFYGMVEMLRRSLHKKVDLLDTGQLQNNEELLDEVLKYGIRIYGKDQGRWVLSEKNN